MEWKSVVFGINVTIKVAGATTKARPICVRLPLVDDGMNFYRVFWCFTQKKNFALRRQTNKNENENLLMMGMDMAASMLDDAHKE